MVRPAVDDGQRASGLRAPDPATTDRLTRDPLREGGFKTLGSFQNNAFVANEVHGLSMSHSGRSLHRVVRRR